MSQHAQLMRACLDAVGAKSVLEVGAYAGDLTRVLADWAAGTGARVLAVDPSPQPALVELSEQHEGVELVRQTSIQALPEVEMPDVAILDGDHNYYTVYEELRLIGERVRDKKLPLLLFHDVCWPHGRRDDYFDQSLIPEEYRHPMVGDGKGIFPGDPGVRADGLPYPRSAAHEGGPRNGVLTAIEDFVAEHEGLRLAVVPAFFGFGAVWHENAKFASDLATILDPWDRHQLLERLEGNRVMHIAQEHAQRIAVWQAEERSRQLESLLQRLLRSSSFSLAERLGRLRVRAGIAPGDPPIMRDDLKRALKT